MRDSPAVWSGWAHTAKSESPGSFSGELSTKLHATQLCSKPGTLDPAARFAGFRDYFHLRYSSGSVHADNRKLWSHFRRTSRNHRPTPTLSWRKLSILLIP